MCRLVRRDCISRWFIPGLGVATPMKLPRGIFLAIFLLAGPCVAWACTPYIEEHPGWTSASFRPHTDAFEHCDVSEAVYRQVVGDWLRARTPDLPTISSLSLGRAVTFPWISRYLADSALQSPGWAARVSRARKGERDRLAAPILSAPALLQRLAVPFEGTPYEVVGVSFEKVLFGRADKYASDLRAGEVKVPFDAQLWLKLAPRK